MKLIRCYIENFGKLQNFSYEFKDGLNVIKEENGFGKTTFATFICCAVPEEYPIYQSEDDYYKEYQH